jgi:hypothetical protein
MTRKSAEIKELVTYKILKGFMKAIYAITYLGLELYTVNFRRMA